MDQEMGDGFAVFQRAGGSNNEATELVHDALYSAGLQMEGHRFSAPQLVVDVAYAYLDGAGNQLGEIRHTRVLESFARYPLAQFGDVSADVQWISDEVIDAQNPQLWVIGTRLNLNF